jgi:hexosaminidase
MRVSTPASSLLLAALVLAEPASAAGPDELSAMGYSVVPAPRAVRLSGARVTIDASWTLALSNVDARDIAVRSLQQDFHDFHALDLKPNAGTGARILLSIVPGSVKTGASPEIDAQAYRITIRDARIELTGNAPAGLFYAVQTLVQLARRDAAHRLTVPAGVIEDWPALQLRFLHWDAQQHQDRPETLRRYLDWAARFKANMIAFQLEDKFDFASHPSIGVPGAYSSSQLQQLVDYGLERHIQIVPMIQAPAHFSWALKQPEFASIRSDGNNYQASMCEPGTYDLIFSLYDDVINATRGVDYLFVSTDEVYYAGIDSRCDKPYNPVNRSLRWIEFVRRAHEHLAKRNRRMLIWAEYPLLTEHVRLIPPDVIDGVIGDADFLPEENKLGMRQLAYTSMQAVELLFPDHFLHLREAYETLANGKHRKGDPIGAFGAAWDASGLHNETFWLGWSAVANWAWNPGAASVERHVASFFDAYFGPNTEGMASLYRLMHEQAQAWENTWDRVPSRVKGPAYGNSFGKGIGTLREDMTLSVPALPALPDLKVNPFIAGQYATFLEEARRRLPENEQLILGLQENMGRAGRNRFTLEVMLALARFAGHHWRLLNAMATAERRLREAQEAARKPDPRRAVRELGAAYDCMDEVQRDLSRSFDQVKTVFEKTAFPRGQSVSGKHYLDIQDDTKDYWAARRPDLTYMTAPDESIGLDRWLKSLSGIIQEYASVHAIPVEAAAR